MADEYTQVYDGAWIDLDTNPLYLACCHCSLVHLVKYRIGPRGQVQVQYFQEPRMTRNLRRKSGGKRTVKR